MAEDKLTDILESTEVTEDEVKEIEQAQANGEQLFGGAELGQMMNQMLKESDAELEEIADLAYKATLAELGMSNDSL